MGDGVVSLRGVRVTYGSHAALDDVDLEVRTGERVAVVGPSGAGKSTLLGLLTGAVVPDRGEVEVFGRCLGMASERELRAMRARVGVVRQQLDLVGPLRVVHNVNAGRLGQWSTARALRSLMRPVEPDVARAALAKVGLGDRLHERTDRLSGGEQQRVALARVLVQEPDLIVADEPVSNLDRAHAEEVMTLLCDRVADPGAALLLSLHDLALARSRCDRVVGLRLGRVAFDVPASAVDDAMADALYCLDR